ncbi:MAG: hypothetical protein WC955_08130 [Elusimicrobiota bacterium]
MTRVLEGILDPTGMFTVEVGTLPHHSVKVQVNIIAENSAAKNKKRVIKEMDSIRYRLSKKANGKSGVGIIREWREKRCRY